MRLRLTVFGDRSTACRCDKNASTGSTTAASRSTSVHDSASPNAITTGCTRHPSSLTDTEDNESTTHFTASQKVCHLRHGRPISSLR
jgi:hypothetical protein